MYTIKLTETNYNLILKVAEIVLKLGVVLAGKGHISSKELLALGSLRMSLKEQKEKADKAQNRRSAYAKMLEGKAVKIMNERQVNLREAYSILFDLEKEEVKGDN